MRTDQILDAIYALEVTPTEKFLLITLARYVNSEMECFPSQRLLCEQTGLARSTVSLSIKKLVDQGVLSKESQVRKNGSNTSVKYRINVLHTNQNVRLSDIPPVRPSDMEGARSSYTGCGDVRLSDTHKSNYIYINNISRSKELLPIPPTRDREIERESMRERERTPEIRVVPVDFSNAVKPEPQPEPKPDPPLEEPLIFDGEFRCQVDGKIARRRLTQKESEYIKTVHQRLRVYLPPELLLDDEFENMQEWLDRQTSKSRLPVNLGLFAKNWLGRIQRDGKSAGAAYKEKIAEKKREEENKKWWEEWHAKELAERRARFAAAALDAKLNPPLPSVEAKYERMASSAPSTTTTTPAEASGSTEPQANGSTSAMPADGGATPTTSGEVWVEEILNSRPTQDDGSGLFLPTKVVT